MTLRATVKDAVRQQVTWIKNGKLVTEAAVPAHGDVRLEVEAQAGDWFTLVVHDGGGPTAFANAIYIK